MRIRLNFSALRLTTKREYAIRFIVGGTVTALAGVISKKLGPGIGGMFLAFPAIFPASATLVEKHEKEKKEEEGLKGVRSGRVAAGYDASGAAMGSAGLFVFAVLVWRLLAVYPAWAVLTGAAFVWLAVSLAIWRILAKGGKDPTR